ncbi:hypothetical protein [Methanogenium sp. MK-MG]|uniref:hypothetical protein n=1 Tax=Methanogenium sp. MK-MG TaxID=2599926 RepID=UPI0013EA554E|nr:hypothetical protein [Methanogenium sp. MK-MG]KAF1078642.1 hypothetical protein MKMG_00395 [Methanogenium sp. MK-MG]
MDDSYGIFTTDGETVAGGLHDEYVTDLAERLDESTASLYISTKNGIVLLGTAVNVQKKGRRPDTFIYLERTGWSGGLPPRIDLPFIHAFYGRVMRRLSEIEYEVRDPASYGDFFDERHKQAITGLLNSNAADYSVGRLLLGKEVVCVSGDRSKSLDFAVAVTEKLHSFLSSGFTIVVAKRTFRDADLLVTEKSSGTVHIDLNTERINDPEWEDIYRNMGIFAQNPAIRQRLSGETSRRTITERLVSEYKRNKKMSPGMEGRFGEFLTREKIGIVDRSFRDLSSPAYEPQEKKLPEHPKESDYGKWKINDYDREGLEREYEKHMEEEKKAKVRLLAVVGVCAILLAAVVFFFVIPPGFITPGHNTTGIPHITPSATIAPDMSLIITRLNTTPGNIPANLSGFGSAYDIMVLTPQDVTIAVNADYQPERSYYLMRYNQSVYAWALVNTTLLISGDSATFFIPDSGIYRLFTDREDSI